MKKISWVLKIILTALVCIGVGMITNKSMADGYQSASAVDSGVKITDGNKTKAYYEIMSGDSAYTDFCIKGGANLYGTQIYNSSNLYEIASPTSYFKTTGNYNSAMWLIDNAYIANVDDSTKAVIKENLKSQMNDEVAIRALDELSDEQIMAVQACVLWRFSINVDTLKDNASVVTNNATKTEYAQRLQNHLLVVANAHSNYTHRDINAQLSKGDNFTINTDTRKAGPFTSNVELNTSNIILIVNGNEYKTGFNIDKSDNKYYITLPSGSVKTGDGVTNNVEIKYKGIKTTAYLLTKTKYQNLVTFTKSLVSISANASSTTPVPELDLALVKSIISFTDPNTGETCDTERFNPSTDVSTTGLENKTSKDASYNIRKSVLKVQPGSIVTYRLYVYNEGESDATAKIVDYIPEELKVKNTNVWDIVGTVTIDGKNYTKIVLKNVSQNIPGYKGGKISYIFRDVVCTLSNEAIVGEELRNYAEIFSEQGSTTQTDRDSAPNTIGTRLREYTTTVDNIQNNTLFKSKYNQQDDDDFERVIVVKKGFDLALRKYISKINDVPTNREPAIFGKYNSKVKPDANMYVKYLKSGGTTFTYNHPKDTVEVKKGDYITYTIRVYNEGLVGDYNGYAYKIIDRLPEGLEYDEVKTEQANSEIEWIYNISYDDGTVIINAKDGEEYNLYNILKCYAEVMLNDKGTYYQEVNIVCKVKENAATQTELINEAHIAEYSIEGIGIVDAISENMGNTRVTDRDSTISNIETDTSTQILKSAKEKLSNYTVEFDDYIPGVQDDDDFDSIKIKEITDKTFCFNVKKTQYIGTPGAPNEPDSIISGVKIKYDDTEQAITAQDGIAELYIDKDIPEEWYTQGKVICTKINELSSVNNEYVPIQGPIYAYYTFKIENDAVKIDEVKLSYVEYKNITKAQFNKLTNRITVDLKNGGAVTVDISKSENSNDIIVKIPNPLITGDYTLELQKVDENSQPIEGIEFSVNEETPITTSKTGKVIIGSTLSGEGWSYDTITEKDVSKAIDGKQYIKLSESIVIYRYTEIVNYKYQVTKIGFGQNDNECINIANGTITKTQPVQLENGDTVTVTLVATTINNVTTLKLIVPNISEKYKLQIQKVDLENNPLEGVTFKVNDQITDPTDANGLVQILEKELTNTTDVYTISEVNINNQYIKLANSVKIYISASNNSGALNASFSDRLSTMKTKTVKLADGTNVTLSINTIEDEDKNVIVQLVIPNKDAPSNYKFLLKKLDAYTGKPLTGTVKFGVQEIKPDITINADTVINPTDIISTKNVDVIGQAELDCKDEIDKGTSYRYKITEDEVPQNYIKTLTEDIIVKIDIDSEGKASAYIERYNGKLLAQNEQEKYAKITVGENNEITLEITNIRKIEYNFNLRKTDTNGELIYTDVTNPGAEFNIDINSKDVQGSNKEELKNIVVNGEYNINRKNVVEGAELSAKIEEVQSKVGYINLLEGKYLIVKYKIETGTRNLKIVTQDGNNFLIYNSENDVVINKADAQELYDAISVTVNNTTSIPQINVEVPNEKIEGNYSLQLVKTGEDESTILNNVEFSVNNNTYKTNEQGIAKIVSGKEINVNNVNTKDQYDIKEMNIGENKYIALDDEFTVYVTKGIVTEGYTSTGIVKQIYAATGVSFERNGTPSTQIQKTVTLKNGETVEVKAKIENGLVKIIVPNIKIKGKYNLNIKKVSSQNPNEIVGGVKFSVLDSMQVPHLVTTSQTTGIGTVINDKEILSEGSDVYMITETEVPEGYRLLKYHKIIARVTTGLSEDGNSYIPTGVSLSLVKSSGGEETELEENLLNKGLKYSIENETITITIPNQETTDYNFKIQKIDADNNTEFLDTAKFTIDGPNGNIITNQTLTNGVYTKQEQNVNVDSEYVYQIRETEVPVGYQNILNGAYLEVTVVLDLNGNIDTQASAVAIKCEDINIDLTEIIKKVQSISPYIHSLDFDAQTKTVILTIENPKITQDFNLNLVKHELNSDKQVSGAEFELKQSTDNGATYGQVINTYTTPIVGNLISVNGAIAGSKYYYQLEETQTPESYVSEFKNIQFTVDVSTSGVVTSQITKIYDGTNWINYNPDTHENYISLSVGINNKIEISWANSAEYKIKLFKKFYTETGTPTTANSEPKFKIERIWPNTQILHNGELSSNQIEMIEDRINANSTYRYRITETEVPVGFSKLIENVPIVLTIRTGNDGKIMSNTSTTVGYSWKIENTTGLSKEELQSIESMIRVELENNEISVNVDNHYENYYQVQIVKQDKEGNELPGTTFAINMPDGTNFDGNTAIAGIQNPVTDGSGYILLGHRDLAINAIEKYEITEIVPTLGYNLLEGKVTVNVDLTGVTVASDLNMSKLSLNYKDKNGTPETLEGLTASVEMVENLPTIKVVIPNTIKEHSLKLMKVDADDNTQFLNTAKFTIDGPNGNIITNESLTNGTIVIKEDNVTEQTEYIYQIRETQTPEGYQNILDGAYLEVIVVVDAQGDIDIANSSVSIKCEDINIPIASIISKIRTIAPYIHDLEYDAENKTVNLTVENPKITKDFSLSLFKHELNSEKAVSGAKFELKQSTDNGATYTQTINTYTTPVAGELTSIEGAVVRSKYYYQLEETQTPENYASKFKNIRFVIEVSETGEVSARITKIYDGTNWVDYDAATHQNYISLNVGTDNKIEISWANIAEYKIKILKNFYSGTGTPATPGAEASFKVERIWPVTQVLYNGELNSAQCEILEDKIYANSTYRYRITETETPVGFSELIEDVPIILTIRTDDNGKVISNTSTTSGSSWKPENPAGLSVATLQAIGKMIKLQIQDNEISVNVDNYYENYYQVQLVKQDENGNVKQGATFAINMPDGISFDANSAIAGIQNPVTNSEGTISLGYRDIATNAVEKYEITEVVPPAGFNLLKGKITLNVDLTGVTVATDLDMADLTLTYEDEGGTVVALEGLKAEVSIIGKTPIIRVIIPNDGIEHLFKLVKVDGNGNIVTAEEQANGSYDGAYFSVTRRLISGDNIAAGTPLEETLLSNEVLLAGTLQAPAGSYLNGQYVYVIQEQKSKTGLTNILDGYVLDVTVKTDATGKVIQPEQGNTEKTNFKVIEPHTGLPVTSDFEEYITLNVIQDENGVDVVQLQIENPTKYKLKLNKKKTNGTELSTAKLSAVEVNDDNTNGQTYIMENVSTTITGEREIKVGETQQWKVYELATKAPYVNVLGTNYILITVEKTEDGLVVRNYKIYDEHDQEVPNSDIAYSYIDVGILNENATEIVEVTIENPLTYNLELIKYDTNNNEITNANLEITTGGNTYTNEGTSRITIEKPITDIGDITEYTIKEINVDSPYVNILNGKSIRVGVYMNKDSKIEVALFNIVNNQTQEVLKKTDIAYSYVSYSIVETNGIQTVQIKLENPYTYKFKIAKNDTNGNELAGADLKVEKNGMVYTNLKAASRTLTERQVDIGDVTRYKITELATPAPHVNILKDKYILMDVLMQSIGRAKINSFKIYNNDGTEVPTSDICYAYVTYNITTSEGIDTVNLVIENPVEYKINVLKTDTQGNELDGPNIKILQNGIIFNTQGNPNYTLTETVVDIGTVTNYTIAESATIDPYVNILKGKYIKLGVLVNQEEKLEVVKLKVYNTNDDTEVPETDKVYSYISAKVVGTETQTVQLQIQNPTKYKLKLNKKKTNGTELSTARLSAVEVNSNNTDGQTYLMENVSSITTGEREIKIGETQQWKVYELDTQTPYVNILKTNYLLITVEKTAEGLQVKDYKIMTSEGTEVESSNIAYSYVTIGITKQNNVEVVNIDIENPLKYNFELIKYDTNGNEINTADLQLVSGDKTFTNEGTSRISIQEPIADIGDIRQYTIQELDVEEPYVNILKGKSVRVWAKMNSDSKVEVVLFDIIDNNTQKTLSKTDVAYLYVGYNIVENSGMQTVQVKIENPYTYMFKMTKTDTSGNELAGADLRVEKGGMVFTNLRAASRTLTERQVDIGDITTYKITELSTPTPHVNILKDKYILMEVLMQGTGKVKINSFKIYNNDGTEVPSSDMSYLYVNYNITNNEGIDTVNLVIENPAQYTLNILKTDTQLNQLQGPNIKITQGNNEYNTNGNSSYTIAESMVDIGNIIEYTITETSTVEPYVNILEGKYIKLGVYLTTNETLEIRKFKIYNSSDNTEISETDNIYNFVTVEVNGMSVRVKIQNPVTFKVQLSKVDSKGEVLQGAEFEIDSSIISEQNAEYSEETEKQGVTQIEDSGKITGTTTENGIISYDETWVSEGIYEYQIKELTTPGNQYVNVLDGYKVYARVKVFANGNIILVDKNGNEKNTFYIEKENGESAPRTLYKYVNISVVNNTLKASVLGEIENPVKYNVNINKTLSGSSNSIALQDVGMHIISGFSGTHDLFTNVSGKINLEEKAVDAGVYTYFVTETESAGEGFVNILDGYYIRVNLKVLANGQIQTLDNEGNEKDGAYYIYRKIEQIQSYELIDPENTNLDDYISVNVSSLEDVYTLNMNIQNPQEYIIQLNKIEKATQEPMNDIKFSMSIKDENEQNVVLKSSKNLGEEIDTSNIVTQNYDGIDGVIRIENILIEKPGTYTITLTEEEPEGYQDTAEIKVKYEIAENNGKYEIANVEILQGQYYVKSANATSESIRRLIISVQNEKVQGTYNLEVLKQDESSNALQNISFNINNEEEDRKTGAQGEIAYSNSLLGTGWSYDVIKETDSRNATNGKDYAAVGEIVVYKYTEIIDNKYVVTKIGFSDESGYYIDVPETGTATISKKVKTENPNKPATVELVVSAPENSIVTCKLIIPNPEVEGDYELKIIKIDQDKQPVEGVTFKVNGTLSTPTGADGIANIGTQKISGSGTDKYVISEVNVNGSYIKLKEPVTVSVYSIRVYGRYLPVHTYFDNDQSLTTKKVLLEDEKTEVDLDIELKDGIVTVTIPNRKVKFDLALQKFITGVNEEKIENREPKFVNTNGEYSYVPAYEDLEPVVVANSDIVTYTIRVYNEGDGDCYATEIMDEIPEGLEFVPYKNGDQSVNDKYKWTMFKLAEETDNLKGSNIREYNGKVYVETDDITKAEFIRTSYLSKNSESNNTTSDGQETPNLLKGFDSTRMEQPNYRDVQVQFKVNYNVTSIEDTKRIIVNYAQITNDSDKNGEDITDIDSEPNVWTDGEDDQDKEKIKVKYFDMALVKWVSEASVVENGVEKVYPGNKETDIPEPVLKVDLKKSKINDVVVKFKYQIKVTNQGEIAGYVKEISDYIPGGLKFVKEDNIEFKWEEKEGKIVTSYLQDTLLQPDESATVTVVLTWINGENNLGLKVNVAEISKDYNDKDDTSDIDSTPDNKIDGEDDIDNAPVILSVQTGDNNVMPLYIIVALGTITILTSGIWIVKKYVLSK